MAAGRARVAFEMLNVLAGPFPQLFLAETLSVPGLVKDAVKLTVMLFDPCPAVMVAPVGATQVYVRPDTNGTV